MDRFKHELMKQGVQQPAVVTFHPHSGKTESKQNRESPRVRKNKYPSMPGSIEETGLAPSLMNNLVVKHGLRMGEFTLADLAGCMKLPVSIVNSAMEDLRKDKLFEVKGATGYSADTYTFRITDQGRRCGAELMEICRYVGPAPVSLEDYRIIVELQSMNRLVTDDERIRSAFGHLVLKPEFIKDIGPAITCGKSLFIYGPTGNGKTSIAEAIAQIPLDSVYVPYAVEVCGEIIVVYNPVNHVPAQSAPEAAEVDRRWVCIRRPVVKAGGELTLRMLDLDFNPIAKYYEASLQMKANNGIFIIDDFGRQQIEPRQLLNRWIVPLDRKIDYLTLHTGMKFEIPFDMLVVFATNMNPKELVDEAFLRRIYYKFKIGCPSMDEFQEIFKKVCQTKGIVFDKEVLDYLMHKHYEQTGKSLSASHPEDLIDHIVIEARYNHQIPKMTKESVDAACARYFIET